MTTLSYSNIRNELTNVLRNSNVLSLSVRGAVTQTDSFTATAGQTQFTLTKSVARNIRSCTVNAVPLRYILDYTLAGQIITFNSALTLSDAVSIQYDYSAAGAEKIYPDMPRDDLTLTSFPRVGVEITSETSEPFGVGGLNHKTDILITIYVWVPSNKDSSVASGLGGTGDLSTIIGAVRGAIRSISKSLVTIGYMHPMGVSPIIKGTNNKIIQQSSDFNARFIFELG